MNTNRLLSMWLLLAAAVLPAATATADALDNAAIGSNVQELLRWADLHNPELAAMRFEIDAANERIVPAGALPDPVLRAELQDIAGRAAPNGFTLSPSRAGSTKYTLMQSIPFWGKRDLRTEVATAERDQARERHLAGVAEIHARVKSAYAMYYQSVGLKRLNNELLQLLGDLEAVAQVRYSNGLVPQQDVIRAQVEKSLLRAEIIGLDTEQHHAMNRLNTALGRAATAPIVAPQSLRRVVIEQLDASALQEKVVRHNPQLAAQLAQVEAADANMRLLEKNRYPDVTLGIAPIQRGNNINSWEAMIEVNLPIRLDSRRSQEREADAMLSAAKTREMALANQVTGDLLENLGALEAASEQERLIADTLLPQAELTYRSARTGYEAGKVDFATLLDAQRAIKRARQDLLKAQVEQAQRLSDIERMVGEDL